ncbi:MAG: O-antigen ligase family protein [Pseudomonadota bacterium]
MTDSKTPRRSPPLRDRAQALLGWLALSATCASALILAANRPVGWLALAGVAFVLLALQMLLDLGTASGAGRRFKRLWPAALLWLCVVLWALVQAGPAPIEGWAHPAWAEAGLSPGSIAVDPEASWHGALRLLSYAALFWIAVQSGRDARRAENMLKGLALWSSALGLFGIVAFLTGWNPILGENRANSVTASFVGPNTYALYAGMGLFCCLALILLAVARTQDGPERSWRFARDLMEHLMQGGWLVWLGVAILAGTVFYTGSRAGTASVLVGLGVLIFCAQGQGRLRAVLMLAFALPIGIALLGAGTLLQELANTNLDQEGLRPEVYTRTWQAIQSAPWLGYGLGGYQEAFRTFMTPDIARREFDLTHNSYLQNMFELGVPAAMALYLALAWISAQIWAGFARRQRRRAFPALGVAVLVAAGLHALVDFSLQMPAAAGFAAIVLGIAWTQSFREANGNGLPGRRRVRPRRQST